MAGIRIANFILPMFFHHCRFVVVVVVVVLAVVAVVAVVKHGCHIFFLK